MKVGIIGLGRMGNGIAMRALNGGHAIIGFDPSLDACMQAKSLGATIAQSVADVAHQTRVIWLMVPSSLIDEIITQLESNLKAGDIIIDGGNSFYKDAMRRSAELSKRGIFYLDCGTSGGLAGREYGFSLMVGGDETAYLKVHSFFEALAAPNGIAYIGPSGTGHYVKMIHNGIEYGLMQAYAEGFALIKEGSFKDCALDLEKVSRVWSNGSIIRSYLLDLAHTVFTKDQEFHHVSGEIAEGGTGKWTVQEAHENHLQVPVIEKALEVRAWSRESGGDYATKIVALLRHEFGGHAVKKIKGS